MEDETLYEGKIKEMYQSGLSIATIRDTLGVRDRYVRKVCKTVIKVTPLQSCIAAVYQLATREQGIMQHEFMSCVKDSFGVEWNKHSGRYEHVASEDQRKRIRGAVLKKSKEEGMVAIFVPNWMNTDMPEYSNHKSLTLALNLQEALERAVNDYMEECCISSEDENDVAQQARSIRRELLALAFQGIAPEGVGKRLERNTSTVDKLLGTPDIEIKSVQSSKDGVFSEPSNVDPFCDYVEEMGWIQFNICGEGEK